MFLHNLILSLNKLSSTLPILLFSIEGMVMLIDIFSQEDEDIGELDDYGAEEWERYEALHDDVDKQVNLQREVVQCNFILSFVFIEA